MEIIISLLNLIGVSSRCLGQSSLSSETGLHSTLSLVWFNTDSVGFYTMESKKIKALPAWRRLFFILASDEL